VLLRALSGNRPLIQHGEGSMTPLAPEAPAEHRAKETV
jgi:hypothetical protein